MLIFRIEHNRNVCTTIAYTRDDAPTGHGPHSGVCNYSDRPNFGGYGEAPYKAMMEHERCAVTFEQFGRWIGYDRRCKNINDNCSRDRFCYNCHANGKRILYVPEGWSIVVYSINDTKEGIDWRIDADQVVFNPAFTVRVESLTLSEAVAKYDVPVYA